MSNSATKKIEALFNQLVREAAEERLNSVTPEVYLKGDRLIIQLIARDGRSICDIKDLNLAEILLADLKVRKKPLDRLAKIEIAISQCVNQLRDQYEK